MMLNIWSEYMFARIKTPQYKAGEELERRIFRLEASESTNGS